ncbi:N-acetylmuramoyl-L-alanine amidase [Nostoc sp. NMS9]|uniref:N-acetylmuramoyl-L-alanine amidase n=1 Tax=Nostoc sp. NMS9 TaxID=2815393 RepID=UPI0025CCBE40|nr:N-acetylmuramoyl-L-alanine amidase [Nostoc sp. NMS9]MBN3941270.1 N-acetylmuramoyl-L-alanine amidase [Nostoc sp. NMS9]
MGRNWAIVVGINHYENLRSLNFAKRDASVMATWFQQEAKFNQVFLFTDDSPAIAANSPIPTQPTFGHVRRFLRAQFENIQSPLLKPEDNLWFFFAGHGNRYKDKDYLMFSDSDPGDVENTAISVDYVTQRLRRSGADNVVLFLDACRDESSRAGLGIGEQSYQGVITFYSCTANQKSWEIEELQHGSFTHSLLEGLRLQGEANCATVERLAQYLCYQVPHLNTRYGKPAQNPYLQAEPPYKMYFILLEQTATLRDVEPLKYQASQAENRGDLLLAKQLWVRVLAVSRGDLDAIEAIGRIARRQPFSSELPISTPMPVPSPSGGRSLSSEPDTGSSTPPEPTPKLLFAQRQKFLQWVGLGGVVTIVSGVFLSIFWNYERLQSKSPTPSSPAPSSPVPNLPTLQKALQNCRLSSATGTNPSLPKKGILVMVDPGHGIPPDTGSLGFFREEDVVLPISKKIATILEKNGVQALLTRDKDCTISGGTVRSSLAYRVKMAEQVNADLFVSIHAEVFNKKAHGFEIFTSNNSNSQRLGQLVSSSIVQSINGLFNRGLKAGEHLFILKNVSMPSILVDPGFIDNKEDAALLNNPDFQNKMAEAVAQGIIQYLKEKKQIN